MLYYMLNARLNLGSVNMNVLWQTFSGREQQSKLLTG